MMTIEEVAEKLAEKNRSEVARAVGATRSYINAIANGIRVNPSYEMIKKLSDYLERNE